MAKAVQIQKPEVIPFLPPVAEVEAPSLGTPFKFLLAVSYLFSILTLCLAIFA